ncbi:MAG: AAA family ATPase [Pseudomonas sp.]|jgi:MinD-like ATPase involved in chromosome partitioning or flagellar assembly|uniref:P-loop ATPase, Sll1717 family n=1 Tax=Pseudomonas sp. TaxID=306 RepID=UPI00356658E6
MSLNEIEWTPLTWLDVERRLKEATENFNSYPVGVSRVRCFYDGVDIECGVIGLAEDWISEVFGRSFTRDPSSILLAIGDCSYPISYIQSSETPEVSTQYPLWREQAYTKAKSNTRYPEKFKSGPKVISFHSFKGGVGRTTALMTYVSAVLGKAKSNTKILLVDADLEAPGITLWLDSSTMPTVSFINFLEAVHYPPKTIEDSIGYFAAELRKKSLSLEGSRKEVFILPSAIKLSEIMDMPVLPSHIARNPKNPWILTDHLHSLGERLGVDMVFVDLRAGLSELSSPLLFDPRVEHFFVTTVAHQSVAGMASILEHVGKFQYGVARDNESLTKPSVILSLLTPTLRKLQDYPLAIEKLNGAYVDVYIDQPVSDEVDTLSLGLEWVEAEFENSLMSIRSVKQAIDILTKSPLFEAASNWAEARAEVQVADQITNSVDKPKNSSDIAALYKVCEAFQFAESSTSDQMLVTDPIRSLAKQYSDTLPNVVSVGAKGAGKTFTFLQLCRSKNWGDFLKKIDSSNPQVLSAHIFPALSSQNIDGDSLEIVNSAVESFGDSLGVGNISNDGVKSKAKKLLTQKNTDWTLEWERLLAKSIRPNTANFASLNEWLIKKDESIVFVIDGIEDLFDTPSEENQREAIKGLLEIPNSLNALRHRRIGFVCFARADYVQASIKQNIAQYLSRFQAFRLEWTPETFLRLVYWICSKAKIIDAKAELAETLSMDDLLTSLEELWGKKMGNNSSKEANTARWVFAALCDLNGRLQARDIVRFLKFSAKQMQAKRPEGWSDRLLFPEAIRQSLSECSREKVEEASAEILPLKAWRIKLEEIADEFKRVPFSPSNVGLTEELVRALKDIGVIYEDIDRLEDTDRFYLPEIYRTGLGFKSAVSGRPRVQALLKRNLGGMPF